MVVLVLALLLLATPTPTASGGGGGSKAAKRLAQAHEMYEAARFAEAAMRFAKVLPPAPSNKLQASLEKAGLGPLQLTPYRREFARALVVTRDYSAAAEQLGQMRGAMGFLPSPALAGRFESDVLREEAQVYQCTGKLKKAAKALRTSIKLLKDAGTGPSAPRPADFFERYQRLSTLENWLGRPDAAATAASKAIDSRDDGAAVLRQNRGAAARPMASWLPGVSGGDDAAWRSLSEQPGVAELAATLQEHAPELRKEAIALWEAGRFAAQPECMHQIHPDRVDGDSLAAAAEGAEWAQLPVVGVDFMRSERGGCSEHTPAGCALVEILVARWRAAQAQRSSGDDDDDTADVPEVERVGYSSLTQGGWIRPHWGETNARLKLHLGLVVEGGPPGCAALTIDGESRAWSEGGVLFFDDSYEHEALNNCSGTTTLGEEGEGGGRAGSALPRIVLQVVIRHPRAPHGS